MPRLRRQESLRAPPWSRWSRERILDLRLCDLGLRIPGSPLEARIQRVRDDLATRGLRIKPTFWLSTDWFTPEGGTGIAAPFYLAHPRLVRLHRNMGAEVEGASQDWCLRILRHELGHVVDHAYGLNRRRRRQRLFGLSSRRYPGRYRPDPYSKRHVQHLYYWYAQSHPDEDFAETFAVWLAPGTRWRQRYREWPEVMRKLVYMDELMGELAGQTPQQRAGAQVEPLRHCTQTLRSFYDGLQDQPETLYPSFYDRDLRVLFCSDRRPGEPRASAYLRRAKGRLIARLEPWLDEQRYQLEHVIQDMIERSEVLGLHARGDPDDIDDHLTVLLAKHTIGSLFRQRRWVKM